MVRLLPVRVSARGERVLDGPRPFSQEWLQVPPDQRVPAARWRPELPFWLPSERVLSAILVMLLVMVAVFAGGGPGMHTSAGEAGKSATSIGNTVASVPVTTPEPRGTESGAVISPPSPTVAVGGEAADAATSTVTVAHSAPSPTAEVVAAEPGALLPNYRIVAYYGHPASTQMGILGEYDKEDLLSELKDEAAAYEDADPSRPVMPAFELIASVAQNWPATDDTYLSFTDDKTIQEYVDFTRDNGIILILDVQIGHSTVADEIDRVKKWLVEPNVHLALDPEFAMGPDEVPGSAIGGIDASKVAVAQKALAKIVKDNNLPPKLLIVHRFTEDMITHAERIKPVDGVQTVIDFDGFGAPANKLEGYGLFLVDQAYAQFAGIKLFYNADSPLMSPAEVVALDRPPDVVIYQ